eukprot:11771726-Ditylum_brightwellii.AAC.1
MDKHLQAHHRQHFEQAKGTLFMVPPLSGIIDFNASTPICNQMQQGIAPINELEVGEDIKD